MGNVYSVQSDDRALIDLVAGVCLQDNCFFAVTLTADDDDGDGDGGSGNNGDNDANGNEGTGDEGNGDEGNGNEGNANGNEDNGNEGNGNGNGDNGGCGQTRMVHHSCEVITATAAEGQGPFLRMAVARTTEQKLVAVQSWPSPAGTGVSRPQPPPPLPPPLVRPWAVDRHLLYDTFCQNEPLWPKNVITDVSRGDYYYDSSTDSSVTRIESDVNNNDFFSATKQDVLYGKIDFDPKNYVANDRDIQTCSYSDPIIPFPIDIQEQTEPIDLSFVKKMKSKVAKTSRYQMKTKNYFEPSSNISLPLPSNISEASLLILKSVYDIKHHRRPDCDRIFLEDPVDSKLYICRVCAKHVRSKWHHFQTHFSRDHKCSDCDAVYSRIDTLRTHAKKRHSIVIPRYYYGIPANVWHRVIVQYRPNPAIEPAIDPPAPAADDPELHE